MILNRQIPRPPLGWPLLPVPDAEGRLPYPTFEQSVRDGIRVILSTRPGEQLMRAEFGGGLTEFLHEPNNLVTRRRIRDRITESLGLWEKRVELLRVDVNDVPDQPSHLRVELVYRLRRTGDVRQLGLTVALET